jgi:hypothetical protein
MHGLRPLVPTRLKGGVKLLLSPFGGRPHRYEHMHMEICTSKRMLTTARASRLGGGVTRVGCDGCWVLGGPQVGGTRVPRVRCEPQAHKLQLESYPVTSTWVCILECGTQVLVVLGPEYVDVSQVRRFKISCQWWKSH